MFTGDFNARMGTLHCDNPASSTLVPTAAIDTTCNHRGKLLANFLVTSNFLLHNRYLGAENFTYESTSGCSVVDFHFSDNIY